MRMGCTFREDKFLAKQIGFDILISGHLKMNKILSDYTRICIGTLP